MNKFSEFVSRIPLTLALLGMVLLAFVFYIVAEKQIDVANKQRQDSFFLADELRHSSDDLTRMVRTYAATGHSVYKRHFQEILDIRDGIKPRPFNYHAIYWDLVGLDDARPSPPGEQIPLLTLMQQAGFTEEEFALLAEAKANSDALTQIEFAAMALIEATQPTSPANRQQAIGMLHDAQYHDAKKRIMRPIADAIALIDQRTQASVAGSEQLAFWLRVVFLVLAGLLALQLRVFRRRETALLGGSIKQVLAEIGAFGRADGTVADASSDLRHGSILQQVARAKARLADLDDERERAESALRFSRDRLKEAQRIASIGDWSHDLRSNHLEWSEEVFRIFEIDPDEFGASYEAFLKAVHPDDRELVNRAYTESLARHTPYEIVHRLLLADGRIKYVHECCETMFDADSGQPILSRGTVQDITERKVNEESLQLFAEIFQHSGEAIMITDANNRILSINSAFTRQTGYSIEEILGKNPGILASQHTPRETYQAMWQALQVSDHWQGELWDRSKDGNVHPKLVNISLIRNLAGVVTHHVASFIDMSESKAAEAHISRLAHHDPLTGLLNRFSLQQRLEQTLLSAQRENRQVVIMFIDMDRFKSINDTLGHQAGDALLVEVARRLQDTVRESDIVARLGGDEFVVVLTGVESGMLAGASIAGKILDRLGQPYFYKDKQLHCTPSIGLSIFPSDGDDIESLMKHADIAMYAAKDLGKNTFQFFSPQMNERAVEQMLIEQKLHVALERNQFQLHYQPQICVGGHGVCGMEALIRWPHPEDGMIAPMKFIPVAEEIGMIEKLGAWVLNEACRQFAEWKARGLMAGRVAVNLSAHQLRSPELVELVRTTMQRYGIAAGELEFEVTESVAMDNPKRAIDQLTALRDMGVALSIDDFGTGYSSLAYLKLLPIQTLKLDRAFVKDIETDENDAAISVATIALAHSLGLKVVAEGVETQAQRDFLVLHDCDLLQGYLISKPLPADEAADFLAAF